MKKTLLVMGTVLACGLLSCSQSPTPSAVPLSQSRATQFKDQLLHASAGLLFPSESDAPFEPFELATRPLPAAATFARQVGMAGAPAQKVDFQTFFARYTTVQPWMDEGQQQFALGMRGLQQVYQQGSRQLAVYRVGSVQVHIYIVAVVGNKVIGLHTVSIET